MPLSQISEPASTQFGVVVCTPNKGLQEAIDYAIGLVTNLRPRGSRNSESAERSLYPTVSARMIVNVPAEHMTKALGPHSMILALNTDLEGWAAAERFARAVCDYGFKAKARHELEPEFPALSFVTIEEMPGVAFLMWPKTPPKNAPAITPKA